MPDLFLQVARQDQVEIFNTLATTMGRSAEVLEKDVWVCWVLQHLFVMPNRKRMAFKGGTSLSKVFATIQRFSEDIDVTLDYRGLGAGFDPFAPGVSKTKQKQFGDDLRDFVRCHAHEVVVPYFVQALADQFDSGIGGVEADEAGEKIRIYYPSVLATDDARRSRYVGSGVLLELGGRNITEPAAEYTIEPDIVGKVTDLVFPAARVTVLSPARTYWEKATLIHEACNRGQLKASADRLARHWYDLAMLADHRIGADALVDRALLADVVKHKKVFFNTATANYDACLTGELRLVPAEPMLSQLRSDFDRMLSGGMFYGERPAFETIISRLLRLQNDINARAG